MNKSPFLTMPLFFAVAFRLWKMTVGKTWFLLTSEFEDENYGNSPEKVSLPFKTFIHYSKFHFENSPHPVNSSSLISFVNLEIYHGIGKKIISIGFWIVQRYIWIMKDEHYECHRDVAWTFVKCLMESLFDFEWVRRDEKSFNWH